MTPESFFESLFCDFNCFGVWGVLWGQQGHKFRETLCESERCTDVLKERRRAIKKRRRVLKKRGRVLKKRFLRRGVW